MAVPITITPINTVVTTDSADMPHVLGDVADVAWDGTAERVNKNFTNVTTWCAGQSDLINSCRIPTAPPAATSVITPATNWLLTGGFADARTLTFFGGVKLVSLHLRLIYNGPEFVLDGGLSSQTIGTLAAGYRPQIPTGSFHRTVGYYYQHGSGTESNQLCCDVGIISTGAVWYFKPSAFWATGIKPTQITFSTAFFTGNTL